MSNPSELEMQAIQHLQAAQQNFAQKDLEGAIAACQQALQLNPSLAEAYMTLGNILHVAGQTVESQNAYEQALKLKPELFPADVHFDLGNHLYQQNQLDAAVKSYQLAIALQPDMAKAHCNLGLVYSRQGQLAAAISSYTRATELEPNNIDTHYNLGVILLQQKALNEAEQHFRKVLNLAPEHPNALINLGSILVGQNKLDQAIAIYRKLVELHPAQEDFRYNLASLMFKQGDLDGASSYLRSILLFNPNHTGCYFSLANILVEQNKLDEAIANYRNVLQLDPNHPLTHFKLGNALAKQDKSPEAMASYQSAIQLHPNYADAYYNLGIILRKSERFDEAIAAYQKVIQIEPNRSEAYFSLGNVHLDLDKFEDAIINYQSAIQLNPNYAEAFNTLGTVYRLQKRLPEAITNIEKAISLSPNFAEAHFNLGTALLLMGEMQRGFAEFEYRRNIKGFAKTLPSFNQPQWDGSPLKGKTILLYSDAALGDTIQTIRYIPQIVACGGKIVLNCLPGFERLLQNISGIECVIPKGEALPNFDVYAPLLSLPYILGTTLETIPAQTPYIFALEGNDMALPSDSNQTLKVGLVWASGDRSGSFDLKKFYQTKSFSPSMFEQIISIPNTCFYSLQVGQNAADIKMLGEHSNVIDLSDKIQDFADTAAIIKQLDLVISVDTAVAHLAGAMAKPVWALLPFTPDWRWMADREDSPWYPTMRLFRQTKLGDWEEVLHRVYFALQSFRIGVK
jgi:tetratricopeptide (TPR) repeat protein